MHRAGPLPHLGAVGALGSGKVVQHPADDVDDRGIPARVCLGDAALVPRRRPAGLDGADEG